MNSQEFNFINDLKNQKDLENYYNDLNMENHEIKSITYRKKHTKGKEVFYLYNFPIVIKNDMVLSYIEVQGRKLKLDQDREELNKLYKDINFDISKHNFYSYISVYEDTITCVYTYPNL